MATETKTIQVAAAQLPARPLEQAGQSLVDIEQAVAAASRADAQVVVLPECCYPCYWLGSKQRYRQADILRGSQVEEFFGRLAQRHRIHIVTGLVHEEQDRLYDAAVLYDPAGRVVARHFKTFLWDREHEWYEPGREVRPAATDLGRIGMLVCAEGRSPEVFASHAAQHAGLLAMPTAWVNAASKPGEYYNPQPDFLVPGRAIEFGLPMVCANKFGQESDDARFCGMSLIVSGEGEVLAKAPTDKPALLTTRVRMAARPLVLVDATVHRLLEARPVVPPAGAPPVRVALLGGRLTGELADATKAESLLRSLASQGVQAALALVADRSQAATAQRAAKTAGVQLVTAIRSGLLVEAAGASIGCITSRQAQSFALPRLLALEGAQVLCVFGSRNDPATLRVRAVENRVFVVAAAQEDCAAIAPGGELLARQTAVQALVVDLDLAQAASKLVAQGTDIWAERRPDAYRLCCGS